MFPSTLIISLCPNAFYFNKVVNIISIRNEIPNRYCPPSGKIVPKCTNCWPVVVGNCMELIWQWQGTELRLIWSVSEELTVEPLLSLSWWLADR